MARQSERLPRQRSFDAFHLEENPSRLDDRNPHLRRSLAFSHPCFEGLLRQWLIGKDPNPDFSAALQIARQRDASRFDFTCAHPTASDSLQPVLAEREGRPAICRTTAPSLFHFSI